MVDALSALLGQFPDGPRPGSRVDRECNSFRRPESVLTAFADAHLLLESAEDHLALLELSLRSSKRLIAPLSCARVLMESAAWASWLLDLEIDSEERVSRRLTRRFQTLNEQRKLAGELGEPDLLPAIDRQVDAVKAVTMELGLSIITQRGRPVAVGRRKPKSTDLLESEFGAGPLYRVMSSVTHGDPTTLWQLGARALDGSKHELVPEDDFLAAAPRAELLHGGAHAFSAGKWLELVHHGCDLGAAANVLERAFGELGLPDDDAIRFWRSALR